MFYNYIITTPANTSYEARIATTIKFCKGTIEKVAIVFPDGTAGLHRIQAYREATSLYPFNQNSYLTGNDTAYNFGDYFILDQPPYELIVYSWNLDDTYSHDVYIGINIRPPDKLLEENTTEADLTQALINLGLIGEDDINE